MKHYFYWPIHRFPTVVSKRIRDPVDDLANLKKLQKKMRGKAKLDGEDDWDANVIDGGDVFLAKNVKERVDDFIEGQTSWVLDSAACMHIYKDKSSFDTLHSHGDYGSITVVNNEKLEVQGIESVRLKLQNDVVRTFHNVKHVPSASVNLISLGELPSHGCNYIGVRKWCKGYKGNRMILEGEKDRKNICRLIGCSVLETTDDNKWFEKRKRVRFSNVVESVWK
ncbi:hypothetical protein Cgig2_011005 [Carnegiea gigantea]|uniref:Retrovirus-related Pol polyprotein from transposon TNT 1-94-like beta-barrel domain-containing protein n=1 Tax=Carnegiea gigantea TaxID=171969 RepID=A0A9Q1KGW5_9CARY|nr:hypothetical protein Cgig2_011005 [Carnegiea gigantea]